MRTKPLPVSGAFHTELMESAVEPLREVLKQVEVSLTHTPTVTCTLFSKMIHFQAKMPKMFQF